jgi:hypothetical protein
VTQNTNSQAIEPSWSRRKFLGVAGGTALLSGMGWASGFLPLLAAEKARTKITDIQTMTLTGQRT